MNKNIESNESIESQLESLDKKLAESVEHKKREAKFAEEANSRFEKNLQCFQKYYPDVANAIEQYQVREDFCLHVTSTGVGNVKPKNCDVMLYSDDPIGQAQEQVKANLAKPFTTLTDYTNYYIPEDDRIHMKYMGMLSSQIKQFEQQVEPQISELGNYFPSAIIFGLGLGYHLPALLERVNFRYLFVVEPDFELFFGSLFCLDWHSIINEIDKRGESLYLLLGADEDTFIADLEQMAENIGAFSIVRSFCYQHTPQIETNKLIAEWIKGYFLFQNGHGFFNDSITGLAHSIHIAEKKANFLTNTKVEELDRDTPVFIVGNGPSLDDADEYLKKNCKNAIVISAGTSVASLYKKGIKADFHVLIERPYANYKIFGDIVPPEVYEDMNLLGVNTLYPDTIDRYKWAGITVKGNESGTDLLGMLSQTCIGTNLPQIPYCNPVVANTALSYAMYLGFKNIYLFGIDNGSSVSGNHHSKDSIYKFNQEDEQEEGYISIPLKGKFLPGNRSELVETNDLLASSNHQLEKLIAYFPERTVFNIGDGAKIKGTVPSDVDSLLDLPELSNKDVSIENFKSHFKSLGLDEIPDSVIGFDTFDEICEHLLSIAREPVKTRMEALDVLTRQERFLYSYHLTHRSHLFHIIKGAMLYYHCPMVTMLYKYESEQYTLDIYTELNELWQGYILEMQSYFPEHYRTKCDHGSDWFE
ncbi:6-hydroxymethylpterin diphosphokinase MptE-like protein [Pseudoalteromonas luteoviolacea]|uniref:Septum formation inhibitor Maf n=1 Tax=Pseudoalteromonas luteoviolacea DSM 6061 TaxID=1365250 RepID=A0A166VL84_9GAMM|nr:6-hydroxymethylpterin diphosphokinase MptE-like protein [Pseudoalteromonas luteoviolacea]KZN32991.1 hypothetical protein N475_20945 [Pseudoalteromonas luteoviolacea DSM 6061]MBE0385291.1 hypothetical protein [Pseudoalteromonas luteoviolacea DSM 6061]